MVSKKHSGKADYLTLASRGSEHAQLLSVATEEVGRVHVSPLLYIHKLYTITIHSEI